MSVSVIAACADVVVTNHALLLRNVVAEGKILPPIRHWVVDEAHGFEEEARHQWALELSAAALREGFEVLGGTRSGTLHRMMQATATLDGASLIQRLVTKCSASASRAQVACQNLFDAIQGLASLARGGAYDAATIWIDDKVRTSSVWRTLDEAGTDALERLTEVEKDAQAYKKAELTKKLNELVESQKTPADRIKELQAELDAMKAVEDFN